MVLRVRRYRDAYAVYDGGVRVSGEMDRFMAERARDRLGRDRAQVSRDCMCCGMPFRSEGRHNRLCGSCRRRDPGPGPMAFARPQRRGEAARA
jgi:hypothetical protein